MKYTVQASMSRPAREVHIQARNPYESGKTLLFYDNKSKCYFLEKTTMLRMNIYALKWLIETAQKTTDRKISDDNIGERR